MCVQIEKRTRYTENNYSLRFDTVIPPCHILLAIAVFMRAIFFFGFSSRETLPAGDPLSLKITLMAIWRYCNLSNFQLPLLSWQNPGGQLDSFVRWAKKREIYSENRRENP